MSPRFSGTRRRLRARRRALHRRELARRRQLFQESDALESPLQWLSDRARSRQAREAEARERDVVWWRSFLRWLHPAEVMKRAARRSPARLAVAVFAGIIIVITALLSLPIATPHGHPPASFVDTLFTATSAVCVTGLTTVDTAVTWSPFGQGVIVLGAAIGGMGIMTMASLLSFAVARHVGLTGRMLAASENQSRLGDITQLLRAVIVTALVAELVLSLIYFPRFLTLGYGALHSLWYAVFMAASVFNNAGFVILPEGLAPYSSDWWMVMPIILGTFIGAIGFPVILDIARSGRRPPRWSLHTKLTLSTYIILGILGAAIIAALEWDNPTTYGGLDTSGKVLTALLDGANVRSSGLSTIAVGNMRESTWFFQDALMFIGGGSASTAGGIKVSTFSVLLLAIVAEARGDNDIEAFGRRITLSTIRLAVSVTLIGATIVGISTLVLLELTHFSLDRVLFEVISAFATVGLSTGITPLLPESAKYVIIVLMFVGRVGTMTAASALALRQRQRVIRMPVESPLIG